MSDNHPVFTGVFPLRDTHGTPLVCIMRWCLADGLRFSIPHFIYDALCAGWSRKKVKAELREAYLELLPRAEASIMIDTAMQYMEENCG